MMSSSAAPPPAKHVVASGLPIQYACTHSLNLGHTGDDVDLPQRLSVGSLAAADGAGERFVTAAQFSQCGSLLLCGCNEGTVLVWEMDTMALCTVIAAHDGPVIGLCTPARDCPAAHRGVVITMGSDLAVRLWDIESAQLLACIFVPSVPIAAYLAPFELPAAEQVGHAAPSRLLVLVLCSNDGPMLFDTEAEGGWFILHDSLVRTDGVASVAALSAARRKRARHHAADNCEASGDDIATCAQWGRRTQPSGPAHQQSAELLIGNDAGCIIRYNVLISHEKSSCLPGSSDAAAAERVAPSIAGVSLHLSKAGSTLIQEGVAVKSLFAFSGKELAGAGDSDFITPPLAPPSQLTSVAEFISGDDAVYCVSMDDDRVCFVSPHQGPQHSGPDDEDIIMGSAAELGAAAPGSQRDPSSDAAPLAAAAPSSEALPAADHPAPTHHRFPEKKPQRTAPSRPHVGVVDPDSSENIHMLCTSKGGASLVAAHRRNQRLRVTVWSRELPSVSTQQRPSPTASTGVAAAPPSLSPMHRLAGQFRALPKASFVLPSSESVKDRVMAIAHHPSRHTVAVASRCGKLMLYSRELRSTWTTYAPFLLSEELSENLPYVYDPVRDAGTRDSVGGTADGAPAAAGPAAATVHPLHPRPPHATERFASHEEEGDGGSSGNGTVGASSSSSSAIIALHPRPPHVEEAALTLTADGDAVHAALANSSSEADADGVMIDVVAGEGGAPMQPYAPICPTRAHVTLPSSAPSAGVGAAAPDSSHSVAAGTYLQFCVPLGGPWAVFAGHASPAAQGSNGPAAASAAALASEQAGEEAVAPGEPAAASASPLPASAAPPAAPVSLKDMPVLVTTTAFLSRAPSSRQQRRGRGVGAQPAVQQWGRDEPAAAAGAGQAPPGGDAGGGSAATSLGELVLSAVKEGVRSVVSITERDLPIYWYTEEALPLQQV